MCGYYSKEGLKSGNTVSGKLHKKIGPNVLTELNWALVWYRHDVLSISCQVDLHPWFLFFQKVSLKQQHWKTTFNPSLQRKNNNYILVSKVIIEKLRDGRFLWNRNWGLGWIWAGLAIFDTVFFMFSWAIFFFLKNIVDGENIFGIEWS